LTAGFVKRPAPGVSFFEAIGSPSCRTRTSTPRWGSQCQGIFVDGANEEAVVRGMRRGGSRRSVFAVLRGGHGVEQATLPVRLAIVDRR
jgi:hypothetical protein